MLRSTPLALLVLAALSACLSPTSGPDPTEPPSTEPQTSSTTPPTESLPLEPWLCTGDCEWDCTGSGLVVPGAGTYDLTLTADCTLLVRAWGAGGGGGGGGPDIFTSGGGGGGSTSVVGLLADDVWIAAGGGGGGGGGVQGRPGGGGGGGGYGEGTFSFPAGTSLTLNVGGGGLPACNQTAGDGGGPEGGSTSPCYGSQPTLGGGTGQKGCESAHSRYGGGGGGSGNSSWGGAGGSDATNTRPVGCVGTSEFGGGSGCGLDDDGGGGGGGSARAESALLGQTGQNGANGSDGGAGANGGAGGTSAAPNGEQPGGGGWGAVACSAGRGATGLLELHVADGPGADCPTGETRDCLGLCERASWVGDGVCDEVFDCPTHGGDGGDCPGTGVQIPQFLRAACPSVTSESTFCITANYSYEFALLGAESGTVCPLIGWRSAVSQYEDIAWPPPHRELVVCEGTLRTYDLETGEVTVFPYDCGGTIDRDGGVMLEPSYTAVLDPLRFFPTLDDLVSGTSSTLDPTVWATRFDTDGGVLYGAWHSTDTIEQEDMATGTLGPDILLEGYDDWVHGLDVHDGTLRIVKDDTLFSFDSTSGASKGSIPTDDLVFGLTCISP